VTNLKIAEVEKLLSIAFTEDCGCYHQHEQALCPKSFDDSVSVKY